MKFQNTTSFCFVFLKSLILRSCSISLRSKVDPNTTIYSHVSLLQPPNVRTLIWYESLLSLEHFKSLVRILRTHYKTCRLINQMTHTICNFRIIRNQNWIFVWYLRIDISLVILVESNYSTCVCLDLRNPPDRSCIGHSTNYNALYCHLVYIEIVLPVWMKFSRLVEIVDDLPEREMLWSSQRTPYFVTVVVAASISNWLMNESDYANK